MQGAMCQGAGVRLIPAAGGVGLLGEEGSTRHPWDPWFAAPRASAAPPWVWRCLRPCCRAAWCWDVTTGAAQDGDVPVGAMWGRQPTRAMRRARHGGAASRHSVTQKDTAFYLSAAAPGHNPPPFNLYSTTHVSFPASDYFLSSNYRGDKME